MFSSLRNRFGVPGLIGLLLVGCMAVGAANAATNNAGLTAKQKKEVKKIAKGLVSPGPAGPAGAQGPKGDAGSNGANGTNGAPGSPGAPGAAGPTGPTGPTGQRGATGATGATGADGGPGANGATGATGPTGNIGAFLNSGATETGTWSLGKVPPEAAPAAPSPEALNFPQLIPISFPIPVAGGIPGANAHVLAKGFPTGGSAEEIEACPGSAGDPKAKAGHLCIYVADQAETFNPGTGEGAIFKGNILPADGAPGTGASKTGALVQYFVFAKGAFVFGTWAVTAL